jgi:hypothetical protein
MDRSFVIRNFREGDEKSLYDLTQAAYRVSEYDEWIKHWDWEYGKNPLGNHICVAEYGGQIVSHASIVRVNVKVGKRIYKSGIIGNSMTHPRFRRQGLYWKLRGFLDKQLVPHNIDFLYWFPVKDFWREPKIPYRKFKLPIMIKYFAADALLTRLTKSESLSRMLSPFINTTVRILFRCNKGPENRKLKITKVAQFDDRVNTLWEEVSKSFEVIVVRDREYLNWRYFQRPHANPQVFIAEEHGALLGYVVSLFRYGNGYILDLLALPERTDVVHGLVQIALSELGQEGAERVLCWVSKSNPYYSTLRRQGFIYRKASWKFGISAFSSSRALLESVGNPDAWYLSIGDSNALWF